MSKFKNIIKTFPKIFWVSNTMELFERFAWYGFYNALALYLTNSKDTGALGFSQAQMGIIMGTGSMLLYLLPTVTGAVADKIGYKKILIISFGMYISGFFMMSYFESFSSVFVSFIYVAIAGALFKPIIAGTIAKVTNKETSSVGFGIYYMMINIGGWIGPLIAGIVYKVDWNYVFAMSMGTIGINYMIVLFIYKFPEEKRNAESMLKTIVGALKNIGIALSDYKYALFLIIMTGFWTAFNQLYYTFPVFLDQWADTSTVFNGIHHVFPGLASLMGDKGVISAVTMTSFDAFFIICFQLIISTFVMRFKPLNSIISGLVVLSIGLGFMFATQNAWFLLLGILIFSIGEMASSPKFTEYVGRIASVDKTALYLGTSFLPLAAAHQLAGILSGSVYGKMADKVYLLQIEVERRGLQLPEISDTFTQNDYFNKAGEMTGMNQQELSDFLWTTYEPSRVLYIFVGIGLITAVLLLVYDKTVLKSNKFEDNR
jgi:dipeptide/tripeptide permease